MITNEVKEDFDNTTGEKASITPSVVKILLSKDEAAALAKIAGDHGDTWSMSSLKNKIIDQVFKAWFLSAAGSVCRQVRLIDLVDSYLVPENCEIVHHDDADAPYATIVELNRKTLKEAGREYWRDVLSLPIVETMPYGNQIMIKLGGPSSKECMDRVKYFATSLAGYIGEKKYNEWFNDEGWQVD